MVNLFEAKRVESLYAELYAERDLWVPTFRDLADYFLPRRFPYLLEGNERSARNLQNKKIINATGTIALRTLAAGLMNGITSPARPWVRLRLAGEYEEPEGEVAEWLQDDAKRLQTVLADSNFYRNIALTYLDLGLMGTSATLTYEDFEDVVRFYNVSVGEYMVGQDHRQETSLFCRSLSQTAAQIGEWWPDVQNAEVRRALREGGSALRKTFEICHLIEPNSGPDALPGNFTFHERYWIKGTAQKEGWLSHKGFYERPFAVPRWDTLANDSYGTSICLDALPDVKALQQLELVKAKGLAKLVEPPVLAHVSLQHRPVSLLPRGVTFVTDVNTAGVRDVHPNYNPRLDYMTAEIGEVAARIRTFLYSDLFRGISDLQTVRSASEIEARLREQLVLLGPMLERFENEALNRIVPRVYAVMKRKRLLSPVPQGYEDRDVVIRYRSLLGDAAKAAATASTERFLTLVAQLIPVEPELRLIPDFEEILRDYASALNLPAKQLNHRDEVAEMRNQQRQMAQAQQEMQLAQGAAQTAESLANTEVGAGRNALGQMLGV